LQRQLPVFDPYITLQQNFLRVLSIDIDGLAHEKLRKDSNRDFLVKRIMKQHTYLKDLYLKLHEEVQILFPGTETAR